MGSMLRAAYFVRDAQTVARGRSIGRNIIRQQASAHDCSCAGAASVDKTLPYLVALTRAASALPAPVDIALDKVI
jgi:hypothetical protein